MQLLIARRFVADRVVKYHGKPLHRLTGKRREGKIKIGYLSGDLHMHAGPADGRALAARPQPLRGARIFLEP